MPTGEASLIYANLQLVSSLSLSHIRYGNKCLIWKRNCIRWIVREPEATQQLHKIGSISIPIPSSHDLWKWGHTVGPKVEARIMSDEFVGNGARATMRNLWETTQPLPYENYCLLEPNKTCFQTSFGIFFESYNVNARVRGLTLSNRSICKPKTKLVQMKVVESHFVHGEFQRDSFKLIMYIWLFDVSLLTNINDTIESKLIEFPFDTISDLVMFIFFAHT